MCNNTKYLFYLLAIAFVLASCSSTLPVHDAQNIALEFQDHTKKVPPRGLGPIIQAYISYLDDGISDDASICDKITYAQPQENIDFYKTQKHGFWSLQKLGRTEYFWGNLENAMTYSKAAANIAPNIFAEGECLYDYARFLSEAGDFVEAKSVLSQADNLILQGYAQWPKAMSVRRWVNKRKYLEAHAKAVYKYAIGDMKGSKKYYEKALALILEAKKLNLNHGFQSTGYITDELNLGLAKCMLLEGNLLDAEMYARKALSYNDFLSLPYIFITLSNIFYEQARYDDAETVVKIALNKVTNYSHYCTPKSALVRAKARHMLARVLIAKKQWEDALFELDKIQTKMEDASDIFKRVFDGSTEQGLALLMSGNPNKAIIKLSAARTKLLRLYGEKHFNVYEAMALEAIAYSNLGNKDIALGSLEELVPALLMSLNDHSGESTNFRGRLRRLKYIVESYIELLTDRGFAEDIESAFSIANALHNQSVGQAIEASSVRSVPNNPELAILIRNKQDLEKQLTAHQNSMIVAFQNQTYLQNKNSIDKLKTERDKIINAIDSLHNKINEDFPEYTNLFKFSVEPFSDVFKYLKADEAVLSYFVGEKATYIWALRPPDNIGFHRVDMDIDTLNGLYERLRYSISNLEAKVLSDMPEYEFNISYEIFANLLKPLKDIWDKANQLIIVADGPIMQIPLSCLVTEKFSPKLTETYLFESYIDAPWLVNDHAVTYTPTLSSLKTLRETPNAPKSREMFIGFGDPIFKVKKTGATMSLESRTENSNTWRNLVFHRRNVPNTRGLVIAPISALPQLPETSDELLFIAEILNADINKDVYVRERASEYNVKNLDLSNRKIVMFATHNLLPGDIDGLLEPALVLSTPEIAGNNEDGLLTMGEIMNLKLDSDWVILSACNTAAGEGKEAEALSGLGQAFFYAGTRSILVSSWPVETNSAMKLTTQIFRTMIDEPNTNRSQAVQMSCIKMIKDMGIENPENGKLIASYAHPIFWAPFIVVGEGSSVLNN